MLKDKLNTLQTDKHTTHCTICLFVSNRQQLSTLLYLPLILGHYRPKSGAVTFAGVYLPTSAFLKLCVPCLMLTKKRKEKEEEERFQ